MINLRDGSILIYVPAARFSMGANAEVDEEPRHEVELSAYLLGKYEVTWAQYRRFCRETERQPPPELIQAFVPTDDHPVFNVSWFDAWDYCSWAGLRLPTEAEWEHAGRGSDGREYPWGERWIPPARRELNVLGGLGASVHPAPVGAFPRDCSPLGAHDLSGNLLEWVYDRYGHYPATFLRNPTGLKVGRERVIRGGGWLEKDCRLPRRRKAKPQATGVGLGFRVCRSLSDDGPVLVEPARELTPLPGGRRIALGQEREGLLSQESEALVLEGSSGYGSSSRGKSYYRADVFRLDLPAGARVRVQARQERRGSERSIQVRALLLDTERQPLPRRRYPSSSLAFEVKDSEARYSPYDALEPGSYWLAVLAAERPLRKSAVRYRVLVEDRRQR